MAGNLFTVTTKFGISNGPTYQGQSQAAQPAGGNNDILIDQLTSLAIQPSGPQVLNNEGFLQSKFLGLGFLATVVSGGTAATSVTIELVGAGAASVTLNYTLTPGQAIAFIGAAAAGLIDNCTEIAVTPSADGAVVEVQGIIHIAD